MKTKKKRKTKIFATCGLLLSIGCNDTDVPNIEIEAEAETTYAETFPGDFEYFVALHNPCNIARSDGRFSFRNSYDEKGRVVRSVEELRGHVHETSYDDENHTTTEFVTHDNSYPGATGLIEGGNYETTVVKEHFLENKKVIEVNEQKETVDLSDFEIAYEARLKSRYFRNERNLIDLVELEHFYNEENGRVSVADSDTFAFVQSYDANGNLAERMLDLEESTYDLGAAIKDVFDWSEDGLLVSKMSSRDNLRNGSNTVQAIDYRYNELEQLVNSETKIMFNGTVQDGWTTTYRYDCEE